MKFQYLFFFVYSFLFSLQSGSSQQLERSSLSTLPYSLIIQEQSTPFKINYYGLTLEMFPSQFTISGSLQTKLTAKKAFSSFYFNLSQLLTVDSIRSDHTNLMGFSHRNDSILFQLHSPLSIGDSLIFTLYYSGMPVQANSDSFRFTSRNGEPHIWTLSEPYGARDWFPVYDYPNVKADSVDLWITVPNNLTVASNGILAGKTELNEKTKFLWKHRYPIAPYLISLAIAEYQLVEYDYTDPIGNTFPMQHYIYSDINANTLMNDLHYTDRCMDIFTHHFGEYPFKNEKYGHAMFSWGGGMEHQTISSMIRFTPGLVAHELAHQWFGDALTCGEWQDIWLNESFATYAEGLMVEADQGEFSFKAWREDKIELITSLPDGSVRVPESAFNSFTGMGNINRIFDYRLTYAKGALVLHMLRYTIGDSLFFEGLKAYTNSEFRYSSVLTQNFKNIMEEVSGKNLASFFETWIYSEGHPKYELTARGTFIQELPKPFKVDLQLNQQHSLGSDIFYAIPIQVQIIGSGKDTVVTLYPDSPNFQYETTIDFNPEYVRLDPFNNVIQTTENSTFHLHTIDGIVSEISVGSTYPNPAKSLIHFPLSLNHSNEVQFTVYDMSGKQLYVSEKTNYPTGESTLEWNFGPVANGVYLIKVEIGDRLFYRSATIMK